MFPYGIGRMVTTFNPFASSNSTIRRDVCDLPQPVRTAQTAITGFVDFICVPLVPNSTKFAPAALILQQGS